MTQEYVLGFLFDADLRRVLLINKEKPARQKGFLNGIGGNVEPGEMPLIAMHREFTEETNGLPVVESPVFDWQNIAQLKQEGVFSIYVFAAVDHKDNLLKPRPAPGVLGWSAWVLGPWSRYPTDEQPEVCTVSTVVGGYLKTLGNVPWLVAMARALLTGKDDARSFVIEEIH